MKIDRRITNGLAWAGVVLVVGVPLADLVSGQVMGEGSDARPAQIAMIEPVAAPARIAPVPMAASARPAAPVAKPAAQAVVKPQAVKPAAVAPAKIDVATTGSVVDSYLQSGKAMPSYITAVPGIQAAAPSGQTAAPSRPVASAASAAPERVLSPIIAVPANPATAVAPAAVPNPAAPTQVVTTPAMETAAVTPQTVAPMPMPLSMRPEPVLIVQTPAQTQNFEIVPGGDRRSSATVTSRDLQDWESGPLSEFLAKRQGGSTAGADYDADGFYLDEGPNAPPSRDRLIGPADEVFFPFAN